MQTFCQEKDTFINFDVILHFAGTWSIGIMLICAYFVHNQIAILVMAALLLFFPPGYKYLYYRWLMFKYNKSTTLSIDLKNRIFIYKPNDKVISFKFEEVKKWGWQDDGPFLFLCTFIEIIRIELFDGKIITISSGLETRDLMNYLFDNRQVMGLPYGVQYYEIDFETYIDEIS